MINNLRFELSFKNIPQLEKKLNFCKKNNLKKINIPCKGSIKKDFYLESIKYINKNYSDLDMIYHYSLFHQYSKNKDNSYFEFLNFISFCKTHRNNRILLISGSNKKKNFDVIRVLKDLKNEKDLNIDLGIAFNPYLEKYFKISGERERYEKKISSGLVKSIWFQFGTDIKLLEREINYLRNNIKFENIDLYGSLLVPSKQFIARFKFRPWKGVQISDQYLYSLENFKCFTKSLIDFYLDNHITPVIETDFSSKEKLEFVYSFFKNK